MDFVSDSLESDRRIRILTIRDLWDRSIPALEVDICFRDYRRCRSRNAFGSKDAGQAL